MLLSRFTERFRANLSVATTSPSIFKIIPHFPVPSKMKEIIDHKSVSCPIRNDIVAMLKIDAKCYFVSKERQNSQLFDKD